MNKNLFVLILTCILVLSVSFFTLAQVEKLPPPVKQTLHEVKVLKIDAKKDTPKIWGLLKKPDSADILKLNLARENLTISHIRLLRSWARKGHTIWIIVNGRHKKLLEIFDVTWSVKIGVAENILAQATNKHPILTGVKKVDCTGIHHRGAYNYRDDSYKLKGAYDTPLLKFGKTEAILGALQYWGNGLVFYTPPINKTKYSGARFYVNLLEFGAGYPVPPSIASGEVFTKPTKKYGRVVLQNGDVLSGKILNETISINTEYGSFSFAKDKISFISQDRNIDQIKLKTGDKLTGTIQNKSLQINLAIGGEKTISIGDIERIVFQN